MVDFLIIGVIIISFVLGLVLVGFIGKYTEAAYHVEQKEFDMKDPTYIVLPENENPDEMMKEIEEYKKMHENCRVILWDSTKE